MLDNYIECPIPEYSDTEVATIAYRQLAAWEEPVTDASWLDYLHTEYNEL